MASLPILPAPQNDFLRFLAANPKKPVAELARPYREYDAKVRELFAQEPDHAALKDPYVNVLPLFDGHTENVKIRARDLDSDTAEEKERYIMQLKDEDRKPNGSTAVVQSFKEFQNNFNVFSELSLADLDWNNVVAAGSSVVTPLLPVPDQYSGSKRALRQYYHEVVAPASDVDLFLYGLTEEEAVKKIKQIETKVRDAILTETTTIRTKNAITIASQYPTRHIQIVLRIYKSVSEILTGFDVDCSCAAYDGKQVYVAPRALAAYMTQINQIDLTRRSPSYENRLSKYSHRGFEVYWPQLDRSRVDPTIFERSFQRTVGLARLLVLEKLPKPDDRDSYLDKRREERGRPPVNRYGRQMYKLRGNIKDDFEDEVAEWVEEEEVSDYHTFTIPYGEKFHAKKIEKLLYTKDLLLNAEWNKPKDREVNLHRHPAFFGYADDVIEDCCGFCPKPSSPEEQEVSEEEGKVYVSGKISFIKDDPGRQAIGSFNPITNDDWTEMAYVGNTARLCQAIVDEDLEHVQDWLAQEGADPNQRDYTGRTPLQLAVMCSTPAIVKCLINHGARLVARLADGRTALHIAAARGNLEMVKIIMEKSEANEAEEEMKQLRKKDAREASQKTGDKAPEEQEKSAADDDGDAHMDDDEGFEDDDTDMLDDEDHEDAEMRSATTGSYVRVDRTKEKREGDAIPEENEDEPDFYDVNVVAWDSKCSPLHLAIVNGHVDIVKELCSTFGADVLLPIKLMEAWSNNPSGAILTLILALTLPWEKAQQMVLALLELGASSAQADMKGVTAFHYYVRHGSQAMQLLFDNDKVAVRSAIKHFVLEGNMYNAVLTSPLTTALENNDTAAALKLLDFGISPQLDFESWFKVAKSAFENSYGFRQQFDDADMNLKNFLKSTDQPIIVAAETEAPPVVLNLLALGADPNTLTPIGQQVITDVHMRTYNQGETVLDVVRRRIKKLESYSGEELRAQAPLELEDDEHYMKDLKPDTYKYWSASNSLDNEKDRYQKDLKQYFEQLKQYEERKGLQEKKDMLKQLIKGFEEVEKEIRQRGGKTFKELHPDIKCTDNERYNHGYVWQKPILTPFKLQFNFHRGDLTPHKRELYCELFQAAWDGDLVTIKKLTLSPLGEKKDQPPLQIATMDNQNASPFSIAILRGHLDIAKAILEIAKAQYEPEDEAKRERYSIRPRDEVSDYDSDVDSDIGSVDNDIHIYREIVDDQFTIENIGEVSLQVKSRITPMKYLRWTVDVSAFVKYGQLSPKPAAGLDFKKLGYNQDGWMSLFAYAIVADDMKLFKLLLDLGEEHSRTTDEEGATSTSRFFAFQQEDFRLAIEHGRTQHLAEIMKRTGAGIPLEELVKRSGVEIKEKPKYYQGLTVHGRKRADWAAAGRNVTKATKTGSKYSPLLQSARAGNVDSVEWMLSDSPIRHYIAFAEANKNDKRLVALSQAGGGIEKAITTWYGAKSEFSLHLVLQSTSNSISDECLLHCAIFGPSRSETIRLVEYLIRSNPSAINKKSQAGFTPLSLAFSLARWPLVKLLLKAGADQTIRDQANYNNLLHWLFVKDSFCRHEVEPIFKLLEAMDPAILKDMFTQRNGYTNSAATPLHYWLKHTNSSCSCKTRAQDEETMLKKLLKYSGGAELEMVDGAGETALHTLVTMHKLSLMRILLDFKPALLYRENATGRTPAEVAYDEYMKMQLQPQRDIVQRWRNNVYTSNADKNPEQFVEDAKDKKVLDEYGNEVEHEGRPDSKWPWDICKEYMEKYPGKRRLVSLNEANEVARRLAETQKRAEREAKERERIRIGRQFYQNGGEEEEEEEADDSVDVVSEWWKNAPQGWEDDEEEEE